MSLQSKLPWEIYEDENFVGIGQAGYIAQIEASHYSGSGLAVARMNYGHPFTKNAHAKAMKNARLIVRAVNSHPQMVAALTKAESFVDLHSEDWYVSGQELLKEIRDVLEASKLR